MVRGLPVPAHAAGDAMGEVRAVDDDERVRPPVDDRLRSLTDSREKLRQPRQHRQDAHNRDVADRKQALEALSFHRLAADAQEGDLIRARFAQRPHDRDRR